MPSVTGMHQVASPQAVPIRRRQGGATVERCRIASQLRHNILIWDGDSATPTALGAIPFCAVGSSILVAGAALMKYLDDPMTWREGPAIIPEATPPLTPAMSPSDVAPIVIRFWAGMPMMNMLVTVGTAAVESAMFG